MSDFTLRVMDRRVSPQFRQSRPSDVLVGSETPLAEVFSRIRAAGGNGRIGRLSICCHGIMAGIADPRCLMSRAGGGYGILLGRENLTLHNVSAFQALRGKFAARGIIDLYACAAADDGSTTGFTGNGRLLMAEIAGHAGALVRASDAVQIARHRYVQRSLLHAGPGPFDIGIDCGRWEGNVWIFAPDGSAPRLDTAPGRGER